MPSDTLQVYLSNFHLGTLRRTRNGARFSFDSQLIQQRPGSPMLSTALPVQAAEFNAEQTRNWFSGLLPEETRLDSVKRFYGILDGSYLDILEKIGWECAGAVAILPSDALKNQNSSSTITHISEYELIERLKALPSHPFDTKESMRISLGGFQEKLCVIADATEAKPGHMILSDITLPGGTQPTTHILKPQPSRFPGMIMAEAWGMTVARSATSAAQTALLNTSQEDAPTTLVVMRFDRERRDSAIERLHQEDCCQALGLSTEQKYAAESAPTKSDPAFLAIARLLMTYTMDPLAELEKLFRHMVVNVALGNTDAHAKNYAFLHKDNQIELAPLYDVVPALEITSDVRAMGMRIDGRILIDRIGADELLAEGRAWGISAKRCKALLNDTLERLRMGIDSADDIYPEATARHSVPALERLAKLSISA